MPNFNFSTWAGLAAIGAAVAAAWGYVRMFGRYTLGLFIGSVRVKDEAGEAVMAFCYSKGKRSPLGVRVFGGYETYVHPKRWRETVGYEALSSDPVLVRYGCALVLISLIHDKEMNIGNVNSHSTTLTIRFPRWLFNSEKFVVDALEYYNQEKRQQYSRDIQLKEKVCSSRLPP